MRSPGLNFFMNPAVRTRSSDRLLEVRTILLSEDIIVGPMLMCMVRCSSTSDFGNFIKSSSSKLESLLGGDCAILAEILISISIQ